MVDLIHSWWFPPLAITLWVLVTLRLAHDCNNQWYVRLSRKAVWVYRVLLMLLGGLSIVALFLSL